ncbi:yjeF-like protein, hydroxyethylthiazole kinase-related protein [Bernardetia litoralis DSM 6794]|uniref:Bifunctional NAD(P)H-hydrate repair enzyme n=1 Tax=Bernardetia litoralis (strain ATCC 23117 / DSM 6794 / NBRC 15988 / NCIMB 1366 / Fx l1 / Sio-4) TaxID=880071 RepID=I4AII7_BERLS|nr:bifunctional ADP-dependent NAD(P)H-hydrate dehydratase/NAD(P)H-hydrate epimerase [Bernardetia litoralis]AFM03772.1 yjeF-like protein, hydroxyethylthiazole kinase-related protein [Bernardetia litoralis DSM 6794]
MKILSANQMRQADQETIKNEPISSLALMERASKKAFYWIQNYFAQNLINTEFHIFCGIGNNGGDGLVLARLLSNFAFQINVYVVNFSDKRSKDFEANFERIKEISNVQLVELKEKADLEKIIISNQNNWIIDAIFGYGLNRVPEKIAAKTIEFINQSSNKNIISIDIPSGLFADENQSKKQHFDKKITIKAAHTLTFQSPKLSFFFDEYSEFIGNFDVLDIGLDKNFIEKLDSQNYWLTPQKIKQIYKPRTRTGHKGTFGHALLIVGSYGKIGAAQLSTKAALRSGIGLLSVRTPKCGVGILQTAIPEAMVLVDDFDQENKKSKKKNKYILNSFSDELLEKIKDYKTIGIGCGIGTEKQTQKLLLQILKTIDYPIVIDADALNILSQNRNYENDKQDWLNFVPKNSILTPHPKEFERLFGKTFSVEKRHELLRDLAQKHQFYILLKGSFSALALPNGDIYHSSFGDIGMATGGSGDVLTGIITSLLAQGYNSEESLLLGVFLHGKAGELAAKNKSSEAMLPSDLIENICTIFKLI